MGSRQKIFGGIGAVLLSFGAGGQAWATDYYMSPSGNDSNDGKSVDRPWKTMDKLEDMQGSLRPGDTVYFKGGNYVTTDVNKYRFSLKASGTASAPITYKNYDSNKPILVFDVRTLPPEQIFMGFVVFSGNHTVFDGLHFTQTEASRALAQHHIIVNKRRKGVVGALFTWSTGVQLRNCSVTNFSGAGFFYEGNNALVENCYIESGSHAFYIAGKNGQFRFNTTDGKRGYFNQFGIQFQYPTSQGNKVYSNMMMNGQSAGVVLSGGAGNNEIFNNVIVNAGNKLTAEPGRPLAPGHALSFVCWDGVAVGAGNKIYNNTFIGKTPAGLIEDEDCSVSNGEPVGRHVEIYNNIFYPSSYVRVGLSTPNVHNNIFYNVSGSVPAGNEMVDPKLANPMGTNPLDAMLTNGSPAIDKASATVNFDYQNGARPYGMGYDIGAFEFGSPAGSGGPIVLPPGVGVPSPPIFYSPDGKVCPSGY